MDEDICQKTLIVEEDGVYNYSENSKIQMFFEAKELIDYIDQNYKYFDSFVVFIHGRHMDLLLQSDIWQYTQVKRITLYFDSMDSLRPAKQIFSETSSKFMFCLKTEVANRIQNIHDSDDLNSPHPLEETAWKANCQERRSQATKKQEKVAAELSFMVPKNRGGFNTRNLSTIPASCRCETCRYILRDPAQLSCGHRLCESCVENLKG